MALGNGLPFPMNFGDVYHQGKGEVSIIFGDVV